MAPSVRLFIKICCELVSYPDPRITAMDVLQHHQGSSLAYQTYRQGTNVLVEAVKGVDVFDSSTT